MPANNEPYNCLMPKEELANVEGGGKFDKQALSSKVFEHGEIQIHGSGIPGFYESVFSVERFRAWKFGDFDFYFMHACLFESIFAMLI